MGSARSLVKAAGLCVRRGMTSLIIQALAVPLEGPEVLGF